MGNTNPKVINVFTAIEAINREATETTLSGTVPYPDWDGLNDHIQGIAPKNGYHGYEGCLSGSSSDGGYIAPFQGSRVQSVAIWQRRPEDYDHGGGVQMLGNYLAFPVESDNGADQARVGVYDVQTYASPRLCYEFEVGGSKASAAAITNFFDGAGQRALLATYDYEPRNMRFFLADLERVGDTSNPFTQIYHYMGSAFDGDQYQNFALVTTTTEALYLLGFREDEQLKVFEVVYSKNPFRITNVVLRATYTGWNGPRDRDWRWGVGLQIVDSDKLQIYSTANDPSGSPTNYTMTLYRWA